MSFIIGSQNLPSDDVGTHCEATGMTANTNDLPSSPTGVTPAWRIELISNTTSVDSQCGVLTS